MVEINLFNNYVEQIKNKNISRHMSGTIELIDSNVTSKIEILKKMVQNYNDYEFSLYDRADLSRTNDMLDELEANYRLGTLNIMAEHYVLSKEVATSEINEKREKIYDLYVKYINKENILGRMQYIYDKCLRISKSYIFEDSDFDMPRELERFNNLNIIIKYEDYVDFKCPNCKQNTFVVNSTSEKICEICGFVEHLRGTIHEEEQFLSTDFQKNKHGRYDPTKHCKYWIECIQAEEKIDIPQSVLNKIKSRIRQDNQSLCSIDCDMYRKYLKEIGHTKYNDHVPMIRKVISGISPPQLTELEKKMIAIYFSRIVHIFNKIKPHFKPGQKSNCPYHPYFIYKIIEHMMQNNKISYSKKEILNCIHLQSRETVIENDMIMEQICKYMGDFFYQPTIK